MRSAPTGDPNISPEQAHRLYRAAKSFYRESPTAANRDALFRALNEIEPGFDMVSKSGPVAKTYVKCEGSNQPPITEAGECQVCGRVFALSVSGYVPRHRPSRKEQTVGGTTFRNGAPTRPL